MTQSTVAAMVLSSLLAAALGSAAATAADATAADDTAADATAPDSIAPAASASDESARVTGANDIYRAKIGSVPVVPDGFRLRVPIEVYGKAGYYLYDNDAWDMLSSDPFIDALRGRPYSLYGSALDSGALNSWTMRSEHLRQDDFSGSDVDPRPSWSYPGWRFW
jgi:hypothetical protein